MRNVKTSTETIEAIFIHDETGDGVETVRVRTLSGTTVTIDYDKSKLLRVGEKLNIIVNAGAK